MKRAFQKSPPSVYQLGTVLLLTTFSLTGAKALAPGEIIMQEGVAFRAEGRRFQKMGDLQRAAAAYRRAVAVKPDYAEAYNDLGVVLESLGQVDQAEEVYKTALQLKPDLGPAHSNLALLYEGAQRVKEAAVHWGERVRLGPSEDPWVAAAREKLTRYQLAVPETALERAQKKSNEIRLVIETGKAQMNARQWDNAIAQFERALSLDPANKDAPQLLRLARVRAEQDKGRQARELEAAKGRVRSEMAASRRKEIAGGGAELSRKPAQIKALEAAQIQAIKESRRRDAQAARKAEGAERRAQKAEAQRQVEALKRIEAEKRSEIIEKRAAAAQKIRETEKVKHRAEEAKRPAAEAERRAGIARKAASQTYRAAKPTPAKPAAAKPVSPVKQEPSAVSPDAQAIARQMVREKSQIRERITQDLNRRAAVAMREGRYQDAVDLFKQILTLDPNNRNAQPGLGRAQKALAKAAR